MATTFNVIFLGISAIDIDPTEGNTVSEDMGALVGETFGGPGNALYDRVQTLSPVGSPGATYDSNNNPDQFSVDGTTYRFDGWGVYNATLTYADGTSTTVVAKIAQTTTGELYLVPDVPGAAANQALFEAKPIQSLTLTSTGPQGTGMTADRLPGNFIEAVDGTAGNDAMTFGYTDADGQSITSGADVIRGGDGNDTINAGDGDDVIFGGDGDDEIDDWNGNDLVYAGSGNDTANISTGNDTLYMEDGDDLAIVWDNAGAKEIHGGDGFDTLDFRNWQSNSGADATIGPGGAGTFNHFNGATTGSFDGFEQVIGTDNNDAIDASTADVDLVLSGEGGNDILSGGSGNDLLTGGTGNDTLSGGAGDDTLNGGLGQDTLFGGDGNDLLISDSTDANNTPDYLYGGTGDDTIRIGGGFNGFSGIFGGDGIDTLELLPADNRNLLVNMNNGNVVDAAQGAQEYSGIENITTGGGNDTIIGDAASNELSGGAGNDNLDGGAGDDTLYGGLGDDTLSGGAGDDTLYGGDGNDAVFGGDGDDLAYLGEGDDVFGTFSLDSGGDDTVYGGDGRDFIIGGGQNDQLYGDAGNDTLSGGVGSDTLWGGDGSDIFLITDDHEGDTIYGGEGGVDFDAILFSNFITTEGFNVTFTGDEQGIYQARGAPGTAGEFHEIEGIAGTVHADVIDGSASNADLIMLGGGGDDTLRGGAGDDVLDGGSGDDVLRGGAGDDLIVTGAGADTIVLQDGGGTDTVFDFDMTRVDGRTVDQLDVSDLTNANGDPVKWSDVTVSDTNGDGSGDAILIFPGGEQVVLQGISPDQVDDKAELMAMGIPCFASGTPILTPAGPRPVEDLQPGDLVWTRSGTVPVIWAGSFSLGPADLRARPDLRPVHFAPGSIGNSQPLRLSPQHAVQMDLAGSPVLVRARHLAAARLPGIRMARGVRQVRYHHLLLPRHAILSAAGAPVESLYPGRMALAALPMALRLSVAAAIIRTQGAGATKVIDLTALHRIYGARCLTVASRAALLQARHAGQVQPAAPQLSLNAIFMSLAV